MERFQRLLLCTLLLAPAATLAADEGAMSHIDAYFIPKADFDLGHATGSTTDDGDGYGARFLLRPGIVMVVGEYQTTSYDDSDSDLDQMRVGVGVGHSSNSGAYLEFIDVDLEDLQADGFGLHLRFAGNVVKSLELYGDIGYLMLEEDTEDLDGWEYSVGVAYNFIPMFGVFVDWRRTAVETEQTHFQLDFTDVRVGGRFSFGM